LSREALLCPKCGGPLEPPPEGERFVHCKFCGTATDVTAPPPFRAPSPGAHRIPAVALRPAFLRALALGGILTLGVGATIAWFASRSAGEKPSTSATAAAGEPAGGEPVLWNPRGESIFTPDLDRDGVEDFVGHERPQTADSKLFVAAHHGVTGKLLWRIGPVKWGDCGVATAMAGPGIIAFADCGERIHVHAVDTQKELFSVATSDQVRRLCGDADGHQVFVETTDERTYLLDVGRHALEPTPARPAFCPPLRYKRPATLLAGFEAKAPVVDGFEATYVMTKDDLYVALERKTKGTTRTIAVGFDRTSSSIRWVQSLYDGDPSETLADMAEGKVLLVHPVDIHGHSKILALDARTGERAWEAAVPSDHSNAGPTFLTVTPVRAYVEGNNWIHVIDLASGKFLLRLGN
jgi:hypothetical protein